MNLEGTTVLLTGATGGIGHATARRLHRAGASLVLTGRRADVLEPLAAELDARALPVDLCAADDVDRLLAEAGDVDVYVANAALPASGALASFTVEDIDRALAVNVRVPIVMSRHYAETMAAKGRGHIVLISSMSGKVGTAYSSIYNASKFALRGFGQALRAELAPAGVGVSVVFPGFIRDAGMFATSGAALPKGVGTSSPEDVAESVASAIERNRGEVDVAPMPIRLGAVLSGIAPETSARVSRIMGSDRIAQEIAHGQRELR